MRSRRLGHGRPLGTVARMRLRWEGGPGVAEPQLDDVAFAVDGDVDLERAYVVVGVEEPTTGTRWVVHLERVEYGAAVALIADPARRCWSFTRD